METSRLVLLVTCAAALLLLFATLVRALRHHRAAAGEDRLRTTPPASPAPFDPAQLNDPVAARTRWHVAHRGGASFGTHVLRVAAGRAEFRPYQSLRYVGGGLTALGAALVAAGGITLFDVPPWADVAPPGQLLLFLAIFPVFLGLILLAFSGSPRTFDRASGWYHEGLRKPQMISAAIPGACRLDQIHALQLLREQIEHETLSHSGERRTRRYHSYELNLVLRDGRRLNVVDHGDGPRLRADARQLAAFLGVRLWDASADDAPAPSGEPEAHVPGSRRIPVTVLAAVGFGTLIPIGVVAAMLYTYVWPQVTGLLPTPAAAPAPGAPQGSAQPFAVPQPMQELQRAAPHPATSAAADADPHQTYCVGIPPSFLERCEKVRAGGHPCTGRNGPELVTCLMVTEDPPGR